MKALLFFYALIVTGFSSALWADIETFEREYTYNASENDSKVSARKAAMQQLQSLLIQEVGVQVQSSFDQTETLNGDEFNRQVQANYQTFSQALTKTRILEQKWDGESFYLKAEVTVDTDNLIEQIRLVAVDTQSKTIDCESIHNKAIDLLAEANKPAIVSQIVDYSANYPIDEDCYRWQLGILNDFRTLNLDPEGFRQNLFQRIENEGSSFAGDLLQYVLRYALAIRPLSEQEWQITKTTLERSTKANNINTLRKLIKASQVEDSMLKNDSLIQANKNKQSREQLLVQVDQLIAMAAKGQLGSPKSVSVNDLVSTVLINTSASMPQFFINYYQNNYHFLENKSAEKLAKNFIENFEAVPNPDRLQHLNVFISNTELTRTTRRFLFPFIIDLHENHNKIDFYPQALAFLLKNQPEKLADIIANARYNKKKKQRLLIQYQLPAKGILTLEDYAKQIFAKNKSKQIDGAKFLVAFGQRAEPVKAQVVKRLARIQSLKQVSNPRNLIVELIQVLENIHAQDKASIDVLVWALADVDGEINRKAQQALTVIGASALPHISKQFQQVNETSQRRLVEVMATYSEKKHSTLKFLQGIKATSPKLKFALEDAIAELQ